MHRYEGRRFQAGAVGAAEIGEPVVKGSADGSGKFCVQTIHGNDMGGACAKHDGDVDSFHLHGVQHRLRLFAAALLVRANLASKRLVAVVCHLPSYFGQALPLRAIDVSRKHLALKTPHARARAIRHIGKLRGALFELWLDISGPQITRLRHMDVTVYDLKVLLHCTPILPCPWRADTARPWLSVLCHLVRASIIYGTPSRFAGVLISSDPLRAGAYRAATCPAQCSFMVRRSISNRRSRPLVFCAAFISLSAPPGPRKGSIFPCAKHS